MTDPDFYLVEKGKQISASGLNGNFRKLAELLLELQISERTPAPVVVDLEVALAKLEERTKTLEKLSAMHERQRNEREYAPLSSVGALLVRMNQLQERFDEAVKKLEQMTGEIIVTHDGHEDRLKTIEARGELATVEQLNGFLEELDKAREYARLALQQSTELRRTTNALTKAMASPSPDRALNKPEFAPMAYIGHILSRLAALEAK